MFAIVEINLHENLTMKFPGSGNCKMGRVDSFEPVFVDAISRALSLNCTDLRCRQ